MPTDYRGALALAEPRGMRPFHAAKISRAIWRLSCPVVVPGAAEGPGLDVGAVNRLESTVIHGRRLPPVADRKISGYQWT